MSQTQQDQFLPWAEKALGYYPLKDPTLCFLGHSDNLTFRVDEQGGAAYLLRLHYPALSYWEGLRQEPDYIFSELAWLEALTWEGGFYLQHPIHTRDGRRMATLAVKDAEVIPVTLLTWLEGHHFLPSAPDVAEQVERFGELVARMHEFSVHWKPPAGFSRPTYGPEHFQRIFTRLLRGKDLGIFSEEIYHTLEQASQMALDEIRQVPFDPQHWGMVHADLHAGNFLIGPAAAGSARDWEIIPIDFSFCGFGHYFFDLSVCLSGGLNDALRTSFLKGYRSIRTLAEESMRSVDAFALVGRLSYYAYQIDNPSEQSWLRRRIPEVVQKECTRFLQGRSVIADE